MKEYIATRTKMPSVTHKTLVERPRLVEKLSHSLRYRITLIHAPHGYGKSIAVSQFFAIHQISYAYMQFSAEDDYPDAFIFYLNRMLLSLLDEATQPEELADEQIRNSINLLAKQDRVRYLIFDTVEVLHHKEITAWFSFLVEFLPDSMHLLLVGSDVSVFPKSYIETVLPISREVLAFTKDEVKQLAELFSIEMDEATSTFLLARTWGSPLLINACLTQSSTICRKQLENRLTELEDYFSQIWQEVPRKAKAALLFTALLGEFSLESTNQAFNSKIEDGVNQLVEKSLFLEIDAQGKVVIHPLYRSFLLKRLKSRKNNRIKAVVERALTHLLETESYREAIMMVLEIEDYTLATALLDDYSAKLLTDGYVDFVTGVIEQIPPQYIERYASLLLLEIASGIRKGWTSKHVLDRIAQVKSSRLRKKMLEIDLLSILDGIDMLSQRDFYRAEKLLNKLPDELSFLRPLLSVFIASLPFGPEENLEQVYHHLQETLRTIGIKQNDALSIILLGQIGSIQLDLLLFEQARQSFNEALRLGYDEATGYASSSSLAWIGKGMLYLYSGMKEEAEEHLLQGLLLGKGYSFYLSFHAQLALAEFYIVTNRYEEAVRLLRDAGKQACEYDVTSIDDRFFEAMYALLLRRVGDFPGLEMWVQKHQEQDEQQGVPFDLYELEQRQIIGYYQMTGQKEQAESLYTSLQTQLKPKHRLLHSIILSIEYGVFDVEQASFSRSQVNDSHISTLKELYGVQHESEEHPLTDREGEVLQLIEKGFLNKEIAQILHITERTVKWHASRIYEKLQVTTRMEAVSEARKTGILQ